MTRNKSTVGQKIGNSISNIMLILAVGLVIFTALYVTFFNKGDLFLGGYKPFVISSDSMAPTYYKNGVVVIKKAKFEDIKEGDMIAFKAVELGENPAFHRAVGITPEGIITKGDANKRADPLKVTKKTFIGNEAWHTNATVSIFPLLRTPKGLLFIIVLPLLVIVLLQRILKLAFSLFLPTYEEEDEQQEEEQEEQTS